MKKNLLATVAVATLLTATGAAQAETSDIATLKAQSAALKKQNAALATRLDKLEKQQAAQAKKRDITATQAVATAAPAPQSFVGMVTKGPLEVVTDEGPVCFHGICIFGTLDAGLGYATHGAPNSGGFYAGDTLMQKFYNHANFGVMPSGLSQTTLGVKGTEELLPGVSGVFYASTGINPQSGQLSNAPGSQVANNGIPLQSQSMNIDGTRGGQAFNDQLYVGFSSPGYGQLTFGRHKTFSNDMLASYDPAGAAYNYSPIGFSGTPVAGLGFTDLGRIDDTLKYRFENGPIHFGAMYKFIDGSAGESATRAALATHNDGFQFNLGGNYANLDMDGVVSHFNQALTYGTLAAGLITPSVNSVDVAGAAPQNAGGNTMLAGTAADITSFVIAARYTWNQFKFYAGYAHDAFDNPQDPVGYGANIGQGDYSIITASNIAYPHTRILQTEWGGVKYAYDPNTDFTVAYYHEGQNTYDSAASIAKGNCAKTVQSLRDSSCEGDLNAVSAYVDYHFTKRFDVYGGFMVSIVTGGLASGYLYYNNFAPTAGARFTF